jgi:hypothetical protein
LESDWGVRIVGQTVVLALAESELGLKEQIISSYQAALDRRRDGPPDCRFVVMAALVGGIDASKALLQSEFSQALGLVLFPGGSIQEAGHLNPFYQ